MALPDYADLQKLLSAGLTQPEIAKMYKVSQQAVSKRMVQRDHYRRGTNAPVTAALPWDITGRTDKARLMDQRPFRGLRYFVTDRMGFPLSERARQDLALFVNKVRDGHVLTLDDEKGFVYLPRTPEDGQLVVRWPDDPSRPLTSADEAMFSLPAGEETTALSGQ
ncbi:hypothetical protein [Streptomyces sp. NPDC059874]|uniref:hypothetical protein n=1 Tax=Streptomyces sp. NPDC059874 TaxID=3346983 RepID=UPI00365A6C2B